VGRVTRGYSLIEVLVATLVVAIGALGAAGLQLASSENNRGALERTLATMLAEDMIDRMRANGDAPYVVALESPPPPFVDCLGRGCTPGDLAAFDLVVWKCSLGRWHRESPCAAVRAAGILAGEDRQPGLADGDGAISLDADGVFTVTVTWQGSRRRLLAISGRV